MLVWTAWYANKETSDSHGSVRLARWDYDR